MPKFLIDREMPKVGDLTADQLRQASITSCNVLRELGTDIQWDHSYVTGDRITCVYIAANADLVREHARRAGLPADRVLEVHTIIDPTTSEMPAGVA